MKRLIAILAFVPIMTLLITGCSAKTTGNDSKSEVSEIVFQVNNPVMTVDGIESEIDPGRETVPLIRNNRTILPVRAIVEAMQGAVLWDEQTKTVLLAKGENIVLFVIDSTTAYLNETPHELDTPPTIINERTMLPIRFIADSFGFDVAWEGESKTIVLTNKNKKEAPQ